MPSTYLQRTPSSTGNRRTWTFSAWVKRSKLGAVQDIFGSHISLSINGVLRFIFEDTDIIGIQAYTDFNLKTVRLFRDTSAWYHIVVAVDTTQATNTNRIKIYINGTQETNFTGTYPTQNLDTAINNTQVHTLGRYDLTTNNYFDGSMTHVHFIDGTAYDASAFGETDATTGIWKPKTAPSVTYGTNGFFLKFENSGSMGTDSSGNANNFTVNGTLTQTVDTPSNVFATLNVLNNVGTGANPTYSLGNTKVVSSADNYFGGSSSLGITKGKWYLEVELDAESSSGQGVIGMSTNIFEEARQNRHLGQLTSNPSVGYYGSNGNKVVDGGTDSAYGNSYTAGDIIGIAIDCDNNYIYFAKNGTWQNSGDPTSGATGTGGIALTSTDREWFLSLGDSGSTATATYLCNFGNGYFGTTAVSSAQNPSDGIGIFEYSVPTGYKALCTKSINAQEYA